MYLIYLSLALVAILLFAFYGRKYSSATNESATSVLSVPNIPAAVVSGLDKAKLQRMLNSIEHARAPKTQFGAMCYMTVPPPVAVTYICPTCGAKTLYARETNGANYAQIRLVAYDVEEARRLIEPLHAKTTAIQLIETNLCRQCSPDARNPSLSLQFRFSDGTIHDVSPVNVSDLQLLCDFLAGRTTSETRNGGTIALKDALPRLRKLLGFTPPATNTPAVAPEPRTMNTSYRTPDTPP